MSSDDESTKSFYSNQSGSGDENVDKLLQRQIKNLKSLQMKTGWIDWFYKDHHLNLLHFFINIWRGQLPNLRDIFSKKEIEFFLTETIRCMYENPHDARGQRFIEFVARSGYKDEPDVDENGKPLLCRTTALHRAKMSLDSRGRDVARELFKIYNRFDVNYTDKSGLTHLHVACRYGFDDIVEKFFELGQNPKCPVDVIGNSPQYFRAVDTQCIKSLPKNKRGNHENSVETLFDTRGKKHQLVQINDLDERGKTPLHWAAYGKNKKIIELLLRNGADPNLATKYDAMTPLHIICCKKRDEDLVELFFKICHEINQPVRVNVRENHGCNTPLHLASRHDRNNKVFELLMSNGANPYLYDSCDETPLHLCLRQGYVEMTRIIFMFNGEVDRPFPRSGETPLQWAVKNFWPRAVDILLDLGADLSGFVFPSASSLKFIKPTFIFTLNSEHINFKLRQTSALMAIVDSFEKRGYELKRKDALKIMKLFSFYRGYEKSADVEKFWFDDEEFESRAKELMMKPTSLSLYDLIRLKPEEAAKQLTYKDYFRLSYNFRTVPKKYRKACTKHLSEKMSKRFFRRWALDSFLELTRYRLPILCCEIIIEKLKNDDLWCICLAASGQTSKWRHTVSFPICARSYYDYL